MVLSRALDEAKRLGYAVSLHEEDRALSCNGALNAGAVSKQLGVSGYPDSAESQRVRRDLAIAIGSGAAVHVCACVDCRVARTHSRRAPAWRTGHLRSDAASFHPGRKCCDDLGNECKDESAATKSRRRRRSARRDSRRHYRHDRHRPCAARSRFQADAAARRVTSVRGILSPHLDHESAEEFAHAANGVVGLETSLGLALQLVHRSIDRTNTIGRDDVGQSGGVVADRGGDACGWCESRTSR